MIAFTPCRRRTGLQALAITVAALAALISLPGCAGLNMLRSEVSTYGSWPAERRPASFAFDRLPSQQADAARQAALEEAALPSLQGAGFTLAADRQQADVLVQVGARVDRQERSPWDDPFWVQAWGPRWAMSPWASPYWYDYSLRRPDFSREVAVLIRDRESGAALYEARARNEGQTPGGTPVLTAMYAAALQEFPATQGEPHRVAAPLPAAR